MSYSGVKTEADLTQLSDAQRAELGVTLIENGTAASDTAGTYTAVASTTAEPSKKRMTLLAKVAERVRDDVLGADAMQSGAYLSGVTQNQAGDCGGSVSVTDNSGSGRISGSVTYSDFCMKLDEFGASITMHGKMEFSGTYTGSPGYEVISALTVSIPYLKTTLVDAYGTYADVFSGDMSFTFDASGEVVSVSMAVNFQDGGETYRIENFTIVGGSISGRFYHPDHGHVEVSTLVEFVETWDGMYCGGTLVMEAGGDQLQFSANLDCSEYEVCYLPAGGTNSCTAWTTW